MSSNRRRQKRQVNIDLTEARFEALLSMAQKTDSFSTNGINSGEPSIAAMLRRICEGEICLYYRERRINITPVEFFRQLQKDEETFHRK